jgi:hypothetical protein
MQFHRAFTHTRVDKQGQQSVGLDDAQLKQPQINHPVESSWDQLVMAESISWLITLLKQLHFNHLVDSTILLVDPS